MEVKIYLSQSDSAAEFVCFVHDCRGRTDFSFEGKQDQILKNCEEHRWEAEGAGFLFAVPWEEYYRCLHALEHEPGQREATGSLHSSPSVHPGFWRLPLL